jgi:MFS transporter, SP family, arabinose:H+ symporter
VLTIVGSVASALSPYLVLFLLSRVVVGLGVGLISVVCPVYVNEMAPPQYSKSLGSWFQVNLTLGILIAYVVNLAFANVVYNFRWMFGLGIVPGALLCAVTFIMPMAPSDREDNLDSLNADAETSSSGPKAFIAMIREYPGSLAMSVVLATTLQLTGINGVIFYAPNIFENAGFSGNTASLSATVWFPLPPFTDTHALPSLE